MTRMSWDDYFLSLAEAVAARGDCTRRLVGAVIVKDNRIVSTGYNGAPAGKPGCLEGACPRGRLSFEECPPGSAFPRCIAVHAEANAIIYADYDRAKGATIYVTCTPCHECQRLIDGAGISRIVVSE